MLILTGCSLNSKPELLCLLSSISIAMTDEYAVLKM
jgi:hypothetical protein